MITSLEQSRPADEGLADALVMTECRDRADLIDMANVGVSLMGAIQAIITVDGPFKGWAPADDPAEIVIDLFNALEDARLPSQAPGEGTAAVSAWMLAHSYPTGHGDTVDDLLCELEGFIVERSAPGEGVWRPIAEAPRDGRDFLCWNRQNGIRKARYFYRSDNDLPWSIYEGDGCNTFKGGCQPTHFMPLPPPPSPEAEGEPKS